MANDSGQGGQNDTPIMINGGDQPAPNQDLPGGGAVSSSFWSSEGDKPAANQDLPGGGAVSSGFWSSDSSSASGADTSNAGTADATPIEEPFVGSGGVGSAESLDALRRGHEQSGQDYASDLGKSEGTA